jgi:hypothetical protein
MTIETDRIDFTKLCVAGTHKEIYLYPRIELAGKPAKRIGRTMQKGLIIDSNPAQSIYQDRISVFFMTCRIRRVAQNK